MDYSELISVENLFQAWIKFRKGKRKRVDVQIFERNLEDNLFALHQRLQDKTYRHGNYHAFYVHDPKRRHIHKAQVLDRVVHHLLYKYLYDLFNKNFIYDSYSCRLEKGTHKSVDRLEKFTKIVSKNYTQPCWALKLDIKKFFASVDHQILKKLLRKKIRDEDILWLLDQVIDSFCSCHTLNRLPRLRLSPDPRNDNGEVGQHAGIPLGNLTSQIFANIYLQELDQYIKQYLRIKYYLRYADDFLILSGDNRLLQQLIVPIQNFLRSHLNLNPHPKKIILRRLNWGVDFLGYIVLPHYILPRTKTKKRIFKKLNLKLTDLNNDIISTELFNQSLQSYLGFLKHANSHKLTQKLRDYLE